MKVSFPRVLYYRRRALLALLAREGGCVGKIRLQKLLFLLTQNQEKPAYHFLPYKYGCYSFQAAEDARILAERYQLLTMAADGKSYILNKEAPERFGLRADDAAHLDSVCNEYGSLSEENLIYKVYAQYPYYAIKSELLDKPQFRPLCSRIMAEQPSAKDNSLTLHTIGYEGKSIEHYIRSLIDHCVSVLIDVRHNPFSMKYGFSKNQLRSIAGHCGIDYIHIPELGIAGSQRKHLTSRADYSRLFARYRSTLGDSRKEKALRDICDILQNHRRVALTCFEKEPTCCHRDVVAQAVAKYGDIKVEHL